MGCDDCGTGLAETQGDPSGLRLCRDCWRERMDAADYEAARPSPGEEAAMRERAAQAGGQGDEIPF